MKNDQLVAAIAIFVSATLVTLIFFYFRVLR